jgi:hypothetical protein
MPSRIAESREGKKETVNPLDTTFIRSLQSQLNPKNGGGSGYEQA